MADEKRNISSIMNKLMKKQQELEEKNQDTETDKKEEEIEELNSEYYSIAKEAETEGNGPSDDDVAQWLSDGEEKQQTVSQSDIYSEIINEVIATSDGEADEEIARRVQVIYDEYLKTGSIPEIEQSKSDDNNPEEPVPVFTELDMSELSTPETTVETAGEETAEPEFDDVEMTELVEAVLAPDGQDETEPEKEVQYSTLFETENEGVTEQASFSNEEVNDVPEISDESVNEIIEAATEEKEQITYEKLENTPEKKAEDEDDILMAALGYTKAEVKKTPAAADKKKQMAGKLGSDLENALAYEGKEYKNHSQDAQFKKNYESERKQLLVRVFGTATFAILALIFDFLGKKFPGAFSAVNYPISNLLFSFQALVFCAAFSSKQLWKGFRGLLNTHPTGSTVTFCIVAATALYNVVLAITLGINGSNEFALYNSPAAICLCIQVLADWLRLDFEKKNFDKLSSFEKVCTLEKDENGAYILKKGDFADEYFRRTNRYNASFYAINYAIAPVIAIALIMLIIALASGRGFVSALNTFIVCVQMALPVFAVISLEIPFYVMNLSRAGAPSVVLSEADTAEFGRVDKIILGETDLFKSDSLEIRSFKSCSTEGDFFNDLTVVSAICDKVGGTISNAFKNASLQNDDNVVAESADITINRVTEGGIEAEYNGRKFILGSAQFLIENGIPCYNCNDAAWTESEKGGVVFHISVNKQEIFRFFMVYKADPDFTETIQGLTDAGIETELRVIDPNLNPEFIENIIGDGRIKLTVVRVENNSAKNEVRGGIEGGLISDGKDWMAAVALADMCKSYNPIAKINRRLMVVVEVILCIAALALSVAGMATGLNPAFILLSYLLSLVPSFIISRFV